MHNKNLAVAVLALVLPVADGLEATAQEAARTKLEPLGSSGSIESAAGSVSSGSLGLTAWIDERFRSYFEAEGQELELVDDVTFLRRVYLDLAGRIPSVSLIRDFVANEDPKKRSKVVDELLEGERFKVHTARIWRRVLMPPGSSQDAALAKQRADRVDAWLQKQLAESVGFDRIAMRLVTAGGADDLARDEIEKELAEQGSDSNTRLFGMATLTSTPVDYLQHTGGSPAGMASSVSRVFLGVRLECAQCHDHPFTDWKQQDFWGVASFFAGARLSPPGMVTPEGEGQEEAPVFRDVRSLQVSDEDGNSYGPSLPWDDDSVIEVPEDQLPRQYFAEWMTSRENPHFAATIVNRVWQQLCGTGLTDSVEDLDQAGEQERGLVLDKLAGRFAEDGYRLKELVRAICASQYYQRTSEKAEPDAPSPRPLKVMTPEQLFDSFEVAAAMPISSIDNGPRYNGEMIAIVNRMEEAIGSRPDEFRSGIPQALTLMNGRTTADATNLNRSRMLRAVVDAPFLDEKEKVDTLFLATLGRKPGATERSRLLEFINGQISEQEKANAFSEVMWALINSEEFVLVR